MVNSMSAATAAKSSHTTQQLGKVVWSYGGGGAGNSTNSGTETSWGLYPTFIGSICDDKVYVYSNEHSPNTPLYRDEKVRCLNATTGPELWILDSWAAFGGFADFGFPIADGQIAYLNAYDMKVYSLGKGPSANDRNSSRRCTSSRHIQSLSEEQ